MAVVNFVAPLWAAQAYTPFGEITTHQGVSYAYNTAGQLATLTYPSGTILSYQYNTAGQVLQIDLVYTSGTTKTLLKDITYYPFGPVKSYTYGNGMVVNREYDSAYRLLQQDFGAISNQTYGPYDANGNLNSLAFLQSPTGAQKFVYDSLNRITAANDNVFNQGIDYDKNGNRLQFTDNNAITDYAYDMNSNRLASSTGAISRIYSRDVNGNTLNDGLHAYTYNIHNRLIGIDSGLITYTYNALGQRMAKNTHATSTRFVYTPQGQLLGEYDSLDSSQREYIYLENTPVAVITQGATQNSNQYYFTGNDPAHNLSATVLLDATNKTAVVDAPGNNLTNVFYDFNLTGIWADINKFMQNVLVPGHRFEVSLSPESNLIGAVYFPASGPEGLLEITRPSDWASYFFVYADSVSDVITTRNIITGQTATVQFDEVSQTLIVVDNTGVMSGHYPLGTGLETDSAGIQYVIIDYNDTNTKIIGYIMRGDSFILSYLGMEKWNEPRNLYTLTGEAVAQSNNTGNTLYYIDTDRLGSPREVIDPVTNTIVWRWDADPFGSTAANDDPDGDGVAFTLDLRFPGQYYDDETKLHYNRFRYYDPRTGRFITADPIGLAGGFNTYAYVDGDPIKYIDPLGLQVWGFSFGGGFTYKNVNYSITTAVVADTNGSTGIIITPEIGAGSPGGGVFARLL